jgi:acetyl esterase
MTLHPQAQSFLQTLAENNAPGWHELPPAAGRLAFDELIEFFGTPVELPRVEDGQTSEGVPFRIYCGRDESVPIVMYFHGGGWVLGNLGTHDALCRQLASQSGCAIVSVDYRLSPDCKFPVPLEDCYKATVNLFRRAKEFGLDPHRLAVAGDSAGGNLAAAVAMKARDQSGPRIHLQVLIYPVIEPDFDSGSYHEFAEGFGLSKAEMQWFWQQYVADDHTLHDPLAAPGRAKNVSRLPTTHVITAEYDVLRDEGESFARRLSDSGVDVTLRRYDGQLHGFVHLSSVFDDGSRAISDIASVLREKLSS